MPFYHAHVRPNLLTVEQRQEFSRRVVDIHCDVTGAPPSFVHVLVTDDESGKLPPARAAVVTGTIRAGRNDAQKAEIHGRIDRAMADVATIDIAEVNTTTRDIQASYTMEGGVLLPEPGSAEERAWVTS